uniref:Uncharacterized protein n=1 Tax=Aegilops tauschii subsp. strangulata TaxID=200361 RepID=A0A452XCM6_AEGTS
RLVLTFRRSSLRFAAFALLWSLALSAAAWASLGLALRAWRQLWGRGWWERPEGGAVVTKRDRSMGGKEVVVAVSSPVLPPVSHVKEPARKVRKKEPQGRLPEWWPEIETELVELGQEADKWAILANRLVRAIVDNRVAGRDYRYDDAVQLRQLCKISGVKVSFDTENARDSFYRATTGFVLDDCSSRRHGDSTNQWRESKRFSCWSFYEYWVGQVPCCHTCLCISCCSHSCVSLAMLGSRDSGKTSGGIG